MDKLKKLFSNKWFLIILGLILLVMSPPVFLIYVSILGGVWLVKKYRISQARDNKTGLESGVNGQSVWTKPLTPKAKGWIAVLVFLILIGIIITASNPQPAPIQKLAPAVVSYSKIEKIAASPLARFPDRQYDSILFYADGISKKFQALQDYTDITVSIGDQVQTLGDARDSRYIDEDFNYDPDSGLLISHEVLRKDATIIFRGVSKLTPSSQTQETTKVALPLIQHQRNYWSKLISYLDPARDRVAIQKIQHGIDLLTNLDSQFAILLEEHVLSQQYDVEGVNALLREMELSPDPEFRRTAILTGLLPAIENLIDVIKGIDGCAKLYTNDKERIACIDSLPL